MIEPGDKEELQRTIQQNKCLHQYFGALADGLNEAEYDVQTVITLPVNFNTERVKEYIAYRFIEALYPEKKREDGTYHTSDLNTKQISCLYENMNRAMSEKFGIGLDWPSRWNEGKC
jgi:hypothetical protein